MHKRIVFKKRTVYLRLKIKRKKRLKVKKKRERENTSFCGFREFY